MKKSQPTPLEDIKAAVDHQANLRARQEERISILEGQLKKLKSEFGALLDYLKVHAEYIGEQPEHKIFEG